MGSSLAKAATWVGCINRLLCGRRQSQESAYESWGDSGFDSTRFLRSALNVAWPQRLTGSFA